MKHADEPLNQQKKLRTWLEEEILEGRLRPGDQIDERELGERFGVSRTPVREALLQLASLDLIEMRPRYGAVVRQISIPEIAAMWEVLVELESVAAGLAARRMDPEHRKRLTAIHEEARSYVARNNVALYDDANRRFHEAIYEGCCNSYLSDLTLTIRRRLKPYRRYPFQRAGGLQRSFDGHTEVLEAIVSGNDEAATRAMKQHVAGGLTFLDIVAEMPQRASPNTLDAPAAKAEKRALPRAKKKPSTRR